MGDNGAVLLLADRKLKSWDFADRVYEYLANHEESRRKYLLRKVDTHYHTDGAIEVTIPKSVRGHECYVFPDPTMSPQDWKESTLQYNDSLRNAEASEISNVLTYMPYSRSDKPTGRGPISAQILADNIKSSGASRVITGDLHNPAIRGFYNGIWFENLKVGYKVILDYLREFERDFLDNAIVVPPDAGAARRSEGTGSRLELDTVFVRKVRDELTKKVTDINIIGDINGRNCLLVDDMTATGGTLVEVAYGLEEQGAGDIYAISTHGLFCPDTQGVAAISRIEQSPIKKIIIADTIPKKSEGKIHVVSSAEFFGEAIKRITHQESIQELYDH
tara:strand:+ start:85 stop:1083 length:999 start_codon:yes stop_codon:yes gene_type:complete